VLPPSDVSGRIAGPGIGYIRVAAIGANTAQQVKAQAATLAKGGAAKLILDVRRTSTGSLDHGLALARVFVGKGTLAVRESRGGPRETIATAAGDGSVTAPMMLLIDSGTTGAAELFASALVGNQRAELIGERTLGRAALQTLVKLPDGSGLWLSTSRYLTPDGSPLHEKGLTPTVVVEQAEVELGQTMPSSDPPL
jgi:carboxyl-terminal processing protease